MACAVAGASKQFREIILRGIPVSGGVCHGKTIVLVDATEAVPRYSISVQDVAKEVQRLEIALVRTRQQILDIQQQVAEAMGAKDARIFDAHLLVLDDQMLLGEVARMIEEEHTNIEYVFQAVAEKYMATLEGLNDEYLRERVADFRDVTSRVLDNLLGRKDAPQPLTLDFPSIIIGHDLPPSITAQLNKECALGFATDVGGKTSHTAILARSMQIPAVVGLGDITEQLETGQSILLDGYNGLVILHPSDQTLFEYGQLVQKKVHLQESLGELKSEAAITLDGERIILSANLERAEEVGMVEEYGAEGVGLFRTEYQFIQRQTLPSEEDQYRAYQQVAVAVKPHQVIIRTLDLGGDKFMTHLQLPAEMNPFLGLRAIRFCLQEKDIFRTQLRAILRASAVGNVKIMFPMISGLDELRQAIAMLRECEQELAEKRIAFDPSMEIGVMIEIPSAALTADILAQEVQFFSLGTNDLIQYALAVDRLNERISHLYEPTHPAILRLIQTTVEAAGRNGLWVGLCGEMAGDPALIPLVLGLGVSELSVAAPVVPQVKSLIRRLRMDEVRDLAKFALQCSSGAEILDRTLALSQRVAPMLFETQKSS